MATDLLKNIRTRIERAAEIGKFPDWYIVELLGHKNRWGTDQVVDISDPDNPGKKKTISLKIVRVEHRIPDNRWIFGGGFRYHPDVTLSQMESHAMEMSIKSWINGIPHGGAKGGAALDPFKCTEEDLMTITLKIVEEAVEAGVIGPYKDRWAPDVGTNEEIMKWIQDQYSYEMRKRGTPQPAAAVTGKPVAVGGMPGRKEATGLGLHYALETFMREAKLKLPKTPTAIVQGFGNVGLHFAKLAKEHKVNIVGVVDQFGGVYSPTGLDIEKMTQYANANKFKSVAGFENANTSAKKMTFEELIAVGADIFVPAALEEVITPEVASRLNFKVVLEGANGPTLPDADPILAERGIMVIPDVYANAGGVIVSYFEWEYDTHIEPFDFQLHPPKEKDEDLVYQSLQEAMSRSGGAIINLQKREQEKGNKISYRMASYIYAMDRALPFFAMKRRKKY